MTEEFIVTEVNKSAMKHHECFRLDSVDGFNNKFMLKKDDIGIPVYISMNSSGDSMSKINREVFQSSIVEKAIVISVSEALNQFTLFNFSQNNSDISFTTKPLKAIEIAKELKHSLPNIKKVIPNGLGFDSFTRLRMGNGQIVYFDIYAQKDIAVPFTLTYEKFKDMIRSFEYNDFYHNATRSNTVEFLKAIPFASHYYTYLAKHGVPPTPHEFVDSYFEEYIVLFKNGEEVFGKFNDKLSDFCGTKSFRLSDMKGRLLRAYNSFNRELCLFLYLQEHLSNKYAVMYDMHYDLIEGIDLLVKSNNAFVGIASFVDTKRANNWKKSKDVRYEQSREIVLNEIFNYRAKFDGEDKNIEENGEIFLYSEDSMQSLMNKIRSSFIKTA